MEHDINRFFIASEIIASVLRCPKSVLTLAIVSRCCAQFYRRGKEIRSLPSWVRSLRKKKLVPLDIKKLMTPGVKTVAKERDHTYQNHLLHPLRPGNRHSCESQKWVGLRESVFSFLPGWLS